MRSYEIYISLCTISLREIRRIARIWVQTVAPPVVNALLYLSIFGGMLGSVMKTMNGIPYVDFIIPGIIMMSVITSSYANVVSSFYSTKFMGNLEEILVAPVPNIIILLGFISGGVLRGMLVGGVVTLAAFFFTDTAIYSYSISIAIVLLTAITFSIFGFINAIFAKSFDGISVVPNFVLTPLIYLGGIFYSLELLSEPWHSLSLLNPMVYMINGLRYGFFGFSEVPIVHGFILIGSCIILFGSLSLFLLHRGIATKP